MKARQENASDWRELDRAVALARMKAAKTGYWLEICFVLGTMLFTAGLVFVGFGGTGPERWVALAMLVIITFSIFIGGLAWVRGLIPPSLFR